MVRRVCTGSLTGNPVLPKSQRTFYQNFNASVFRLPAIREPVHVQFRFEFYNAFNHTQFTGLDTTARFDASGSPRIIQLGVKIYF